jgi:hypothetical protein
MTPADRRKELVRLVELDYERTATFINGVTSTAATIRGWAITIWLAVVGVALDRGLWQVALLAAAAASVFLLVDGYHAWLYGEALAHASALERLSGRYYDSLGRGSDDEELELDLRVDLESHRFGMYRTFRKFRLRDLLFAKPTVFFRGFYPLLIGVAVVVAILLWSFGGTGKTACTILREGATVAVDCGSVTVTDRP